MLIPGASSLKMIKAFVLGLSLLWACCKLPKAKLCPTTGICLRARPYTRGTRDPLEMQPLSWQVLPFLVLGKEMTSWSCSSSPWRGSKGADRSRMLALLWAQQPSCSSGCFPLNLHPKRISAEGFGSIRKSTASRLRKVILFLFSALECCVQFWAQQDRTVIELL